MHQAFSSFWYCYLVLTRLFLHYRVDNYSPHEGELYCQPHFKQLFQPKAKIEEKEDREISKILGLLNHLTKDLRKQFAPLVT